MTPTYAVIPTRDRAFMLGDCLASLKSQVSGIVVVDNNMKEDGILGSGKWLYAPSIVAIKCSDDPPNISKLWNAGLYTATDLAHASSRQPEFNLLVVNDDVICPPNLVATLSDAMRATSAVLAYPDQHGGTQTILHKEPKPVPLETRITGYAFMLRGETDIWLDESLVWWYGDDDLDWRCRTIGGSLLVPGCAVEHRAPNVQTNADPRLVAQTAVDRQTFLHKWGMTPH